MWLDTFNATSLLCMSLSLRWAEHVASTQEIKSVLLEKKARLENV